MSNLVEKAYDSLYVTLMLMIIPMLYVMSMLVFILKTNPARALVCTLLLAGGLMAIPFAPVVLPAAAQTKPASINTQNPQLLGEYKTWRVFTAGESVTKICYATANPVAKAPKGVRRGEIFIAVTHRPGQAVRNELSVRIGYPFSQASKPFARIGNESFQFFTGAQISTASGTWAWMENPAHHELIIHAMKRGNTLTFKGTSSRGTLTTDRYSLLGFTAAMAALDKACPQ